MWSQGGLAGALDGIERRLLPRALDGSRRGGDFADAVRRAARTSARPPASRGAARVSTSAACRGDVASEHLRSREEVADMLREHVRAWSMPAPRW